MGPIKAALGLGSVSFGGGVTLAPDGYAFQEVAGPSATLEIGSYGFGARGGVERSYQGRHEKPWLEEKSGRVSAFQFKRGEVGIEEGGGNAEIAASVGIPMAKLSGSVDLGKAWKALTTPSGGGASAGNGGFQGVFRVTGRLESKRLGEALDGE